MTVTAMRAPGQAASSVDTQQMAEDLCILLGAVAVRIVIVGQLPGTAGRADAIAILASGGSGTATEREPVDLVLGQYALHESEDDGDHVAVAFRVDHVANAASITAALRSAGRIVAGQRRIMSLYTLAEEVAERTRLQEIQLSRNLIRGVIDGVPMGLALIDTTGVVLAANRTLATRQGLEPAAVVGRHYAEVLGSWLESPAAKAFRTGGSERVRRSVTGADGSAALLEIAGIPLPDTHGRPYQVVEVWEDITERVALQTQLVRAEKLAAIGQLAASIAHEVGNPLQAIQGFLALFLEQCPPDTPNQLFLQLAEEEIERIVQVLARLRDLYRSRADILVDVNVNDLVRGVLLLTGRQLERSRVRLVEDLCPNPPPAQAVPDQIKQVLLNLVLNAIDAMPEGGTLRVTTQPESIEDPTQLAITISDSGVGIAQPQLARIFDGLHTTKEKGMGLGLYTSKAIIERHLGRISVSSTPGAGTTFVITLPRDDADQ